MIAFSPTAVVVLGQELMRRIEGFQSREVLPGVDIGWSAAVSLVAAIVLAAAVLSMRRRDRAASGPELRALCRAIKVERSERRLLSRAVHAAGGTSADVAAMLLSRGCFDHYAAGTPRPDHERLAPLRQELFGRGEKQTVADRSEPQSATESRQSSSWNV